MTEPKTYSEEYVLKLREEAKKYRLKLRELQSSLKDQNLEDESNDDVGHKEQAKPHGDIAEPSSSIAPVAAAETVPQATAPIAKPVPQVMQAVTPMPPTGNKVGQETQTALDMLKNRQLTELKKDPQARGQLRELYRTMLRTGMY